MMEWGRIGGERGWCERVCGCMGRWCRGLRDIVVWGMGSFCGVLVLLVL